MRRFFLSHTAMLVLLFAAPALSESAPSSVSAIAEALHAGHAAEAEDMASQMLNQPGLAKLDIAYLHLDRGLAREQFGHREEALADFTTAIDAKVLPTGDLARALFDRGVTLDELGRTGAAIEDYSQAVAIVPRYAAAFNNRGNAYRRSKKLELARADYDSALAAGDDEPEFPLYGLGRIAEERGDAVLAQSFFNKALAANASYSPASDGIARLTAVVSPASYTLHAPGGDPAVQVNMAAATLAASSGSLPPIRLHPPASESSENKISQRVAIQSDLRPAILDSLHNANARKTVSFEQTASVQVPSSRDMQTSSALVQLGAWRSQSEAADGWNRFVSRSDGLLNGMNPLIVAADIPGKGRFWRLRTEPVSGTDAASLCDQLKSKGLDCIVAKS